VGLRYVPLLLLLALAGCGSGAVETTSPRLFLAGDGELWVVDPAEAHARRVAMRELGPGDPPHRVIARGNRLVLWGAPPFTVDGELAARRAFASDGSFFLPSVHPDRLWMVVLRGNARVHAVREITVDGSVTVADARPPSRRWPLAAVGDGLLVEDFEGGIVLWDPVADAVVRRFDIDPGRLGTAAGDVITSCADEACRRLRLTDARTGASRTVPAPDGLRFEPWHAALSPDGTQLGVAVHDSGEWSAPRRLALVDLEAGTAGLTAGSDVPGGYVFVVWSASGEHVFITGGERFEPRTLIAYRVGDPRAHPIDVEVGDFYDAAAL
jgi:hypothetical protein